MKLVTKLMTVILSRAIRPKIHFVKYRYLHFLLKIYLRVYRRERFQICIEIWPWKIWDLKKNVHSRFGKMIQIRFLKDLRFKLKIRFGLRFAHRWVWSAVFSVHPVYYTVSGALTCLLPPLAADPFIRFCTADQRAKRTDHVVYIRHSVVIARICAQICGRCGLISTTHIDT